MSDCSRPTIKQEVSHNVDTDVMDINVVIKREPHSPNGAEIAMDNSVYLTRVAEVSCGLVAKTHFVEDIMEVDVSELKAAQSSRNPPAVDTSNALRNKSRRQNLIELNKVHRQIEELKRKALSLENKVILPPELLSMIFWLAPDLATLHALQATCRVFRNIIDPEHQNPRGAKRAKRRFELSALCNDVGKDALTSYLEVDPILDYCPDGNANVFDEAQIDRTLVAIARRKELEKNFPDELPVTRLAYIAQQANLVRRALPILIDDVLFGNPILDGKSFLLADLIHHDFLHSCPSDYKFDRDFSMAAVQSPLDPAEHHRFVRGLHHLQIFRMIAFGGWRPRLDTIERDASESGRVVIGYFKNVAHTLFHSKPLRAANVGRYDHVAKLWSRVKMYALRTFLMSLPPWEKEELAVCAKLLARGYARAGAASHVFQGNVSVLHAHELVIFHLSIFMRIQDPQVEWEDIRRDRGLMCRGHAFEQEVSRLFWQLVEKWPQNIRNFVHLLEDHLLWLDVPEAANWVTVATRGPWGDRYQAEAPPLYRAMVEMCEYYDTSMEDQPLNVSVHEWLASAWPMWSKPERLRAWPRFKELSVFLRLIDPELFPRPWTHDEADLRADAFDKPKPELKTKPESESKPDVKVEVESTT